MFRALLITYSVSLVLNLSTAEESIITSPDSSDNVIDHGSLDTKSSALSLTNDITNVVESMLPIAPPVEPTGRDGRSLCTSWCKKKKKGKHKPSKYIVPLLFGWLLIKSIIIPVALKGLALLSGGAFMLSLLSLILTAIMGLRRLISGFSLPAAFSTGPTGYSKYKRKDLMEEDNPHEPADPYKYYRDKYDDTRR